eukprot:335153-Chlamydomonas_euryale.AAC.2
MLHHCQRCLPPGSAVHAASPSRKLSLCPPSLFTPPSTLFTPLPLLLAPQVPIIAPVKTVKAEHVEAAPLRTKYSNEFLATLMSNPELVRNVALLGHLHHGKTTVVDMLVEQVRARGEWEGGGEESGA